MQSSELKSEMKHWLQEAIKPQVNGLKLSKGIKLNCLSTTLSEVSDTFAFGKFNMAHHLGDDADLVYQRKEALKYLLSVKDIAWMNQVHSNLVLVAPFEHCLPDVDASFTSDLNLALVVMTADCLPLVLVDAKQNRLAVIHAGWRGLHTGIIQQTLEQMHSNLDNVHVWIGPCILKESYQVSEQLRQDFLQQNTQYNECFSESEEGVYCDLVAICKVQLQALGIPLNQIIGGNIDTYSDHRFASYRRNAKTGRNFTLAWLSHI